MTWGCLFGLALLALSSTPLHAQPPPAPSPVLPGAAPNDELLRRLKATEDLNQKLLQRVEQLSSQVEKLTKSAEDSKSETKESQESTSTEKTSSEEESYSRRFARGVGAQGTDARTSEMESRYRGKDKIPRRKAIVEFAEGLEFRSDDDEFQLQFHNLTQAELRVFPQDNQGLVHTGFFIPRQRWYFTGRVTKNIGYYTVINRGYGSLDLLDAFISYRFDSRFRMRVGRMKTPYLYEYFEISEGDLIAPERSVYAGNLAANRQLGMMFLGELFENRMTYAAGVFNGGRRSFEDTNSSKDVFLFLNSRPFLDPSSPSTDSESSGKAKSKPNQAVERGEHASNFNPGLFNYLNLGGSFNFGDENNLPSPMAFRTANDQSSASAAGVLSPTFLQFNNNVKELGERMQWGGHMAWYYRNYFLLAEYGGGYGTYMVTGSDMSTRVPFEGYSVTMSSFLTGERLTRRANVVKPIKDFQFRNGKITGTGAVEVFARYGYLDLGRNVFTGGLADGNLWSNQCQTVDVGLNWYINFYTKVYLDWQYATFGNEVTRGNNQWMSNSNLFWLRFQIFF